MHPLTQKGVHCIKIRVLFQKKALALASAFFNEIRPWTDFISLDAAASNITMTTGHYITFCKAKYITLFAKTRMRLLFDFL